MMRIAVAAAAIVAVTSFALAQDPVAQRKELMGITGSHGYGTLPKMVRGEDPYDQAKVDAAFAEMIEAADQLAPLFPEGTANETRPDSRYMASPKIWENKTDFDARLKKYIASLAEAKGKVTDLDTLKAAYPAVRENCDGCHDAYRVRK